MSLRYSLLASLLLAPLAVHAEIVKCVDKAGKVHYVDESATRGMTCGPVSGRVSVAPGPPSTEGNAAATSTARAQERTQRLKALEEELAAAQTALDAARKDLADQEAFREGGERNYQRVLDRLKPYQDRVAAQEQAVAALRNQIAQLR